MKARETSRRDVAPRSLVALGDDSGGRYGGGIPSAVESGSAPLRTYYRLSGLLPDARGLRPGPCAPDQEATCSAADATLDAGMVMMPRRQAADRAATLPLALSLR